MPKVTQDYRDARREQILDAARRCFLRDGFHSSSMHDLFAEAGLSAGAVYGYFASKDDVIIAIAEENLRDVIAMMRTVAIQQPGRSAGSVLADVLEIVRTKHEEAGLGAIAVLVWAESLRTPALAEKLTALLTQLLADLAGVIRAQRSAELPPDVTTETLAAVFLSVVPGFILQLALLGSEAVADIPAAVRALWP